MLQVSLTSIWTRCKWMYRWQNEVSGWRKKKKKKKNFLVLSELFTFPFFLNLGCCFSFSLKKCLLGKSSHGGTFGVVFLGGRGRFLILQTITRKARVSMDTFKTRNIFFSRYSCTFVYIFFFELLSRIFFFSDLLFWFFKMLLLWNWCFKDNFLKHQKTYIKF